MHEDEARIDDWRLRCRRALSRVLDEPMLDACAFSLISASADRLDAMRSARFVLVITPTSVRAYADGAGGGVDPTCELGAWTREDLQISAHTPGQSTALSLTVDGGERLELRAAGQAHTEAFIRRLAVRPERSLR